ncbi:hypothetical protein IDH44_03795 [Paenibacillus sp. IB182496]|uniref:Phosphatidylinositol 3-/4-kinase n=1 Tax=Paenibacillus sabuli TaxID=2772509 RepID=A0A927BPG2_9BACL|nr:hypothetical protein [Paenibacillus sabuli]MBD2844301.1 hypothetical protein [Paenibacillus sabuli]
MHTSDHTTDLQAKQVNVLRDTPSTKRTAPSSASAWKNAQPSARSGAAPSPANSLLQLQQTAGNSAALQQAHHGATQGDAIQRMPTRDQVVRQLGPPKEHVKNPLAGKWLGKKLRVNENLKNNSSRYRSILDKLDLFNTYITTTAVGDTQQAVEQQLDQIKAHYRSVETALQQYEASKEGGAKAAYFQNLLAQLPTERAETIVNGHRLMHEPPAERTMWSVHAARTAGTMVLNDRMSTNQTIQGGINEVKFFRHGRTEGAFKANKDTLADVDMMAPDVDINSPEAKESGIADDFGIDKQDARLSKRDVALSRLNQMLGANVIAKAQLAIYESGGGPVSGSFMDKADGKTAGALGKSGEMTSDGANDTVNVNDPNLQRLMSRLQLIDTLAMQADRHQGNYFIDYDDRGNVVSVTGIDNDMSFGTRTKIDVRRQEYPSLSKFVDKELAQRILALNAEDLGLVMQDLLNPAEIGALMERLDKLQTHLQKLQSDNKLLAPGEWNDITAEALAAENNGYEGGSYYGKLKNEVDGD